MGVCVCAALPGALPHVGRGHVPTFGWVRGAALAGSPRAASSPLGCCKSAAPPPLPLRHRSDLHLLFCFFLSSQTSSDNISLQEA